MSKIRMIIQNIQDWIKKNSTVSIIGVAVFLLILVQTGALGNVFGEAGAIASYSSNTLRPLRSGTSYIGNPKAGGSTFIEMTWSNPTSREICTDTEAVLLTEDILKSWRILSIASSSPIQTCVGEEFS